MIGAGIASTGQGAASKSIKKSVMTRGRHGDHVGVIVLGNPQSMNRAEIAVAFGRRCGFASGRLLGATGPRMEPYNWKAKPFLLSWGT